MQKRKLIEVSLPLEAINRESAREKSIRHGHPSTLHLWWARRPLAAARAVLFAQLVDDPSARPEEFPTEESQRAERERLHDLIERLVVWENTRDEKLLAEAHAEILKSTDGNPPPILDPFAGGGTIPLEAQRLGLINRVFASPETLTATVRELALAIAAKSPLAIRGIKEVMNYSRDHSIADGLNFVATWNASMLLSDDLGEAIAALREKRPPRFGN